MKKQVLSLSLVLLLAGCFAPGEGINIQPSPREAALVKTLFVLGAQRLAMNKPAEAQAAAAAARALAEGLRLLAKGDTAYTVQAAVKLALEKANVDTSKLHPEVRFWLGAIPQLLEVYAAEGAEEGKKGLLDKEKLLRAADKIDEVVDQFMPL